MRDRVVQVTRIGHYRYDACDVYIGRGSKWGNPFVRFGQSSRYRVIQVEEPLFEYERWLRQQPDLMAALPELAGKVLGCFCVRLEQKVDREVCHGHVLIRVLKEQVRSQ